MCRHRHQVSGSPCGVGPSHSASWRQSNPVLLFSAQCGRGQHPLTPSGAPAASRCFQSLTVEHMAWPCTPSLSPGPSPRDTGETCACTLLIHTRGRQPERKTKQRPARQLLLGRSPPWIHLPLLSCSPPPPAPAGARSGHTQLSFWLSGVYTSLHLLNHHPKVSRENTQWLPELTARSY